MLHDALHAARTTLGSLRHDPGTEDIAAAEVDLEELGRGVETRSWIGFLHSASADLVAALAARTAPDRARLVGSADDKVATLLRQVHLVVDCGYDPE